MPIIHEQLPAQRPGWNFFRWFAAAAIALIIILMVVGAFVVPFKMISEAQAPDAKEWPWWQTGLIIAISVFYLWISLLIFYHILLPVVRMRTKRYIVEEQGVGIEFQNGKLLTIPFSNVAKIRFRDPKQIATRPLWKKILDPIGLVDESEVHTAWEWLKLEFVPAFPKKTVMPYVLGFSSQQGDILVHRKKGAGLSRLIKPWLHHPETVRDLNLTPENPSEFYKQLQAAYDGWNKNN